MATDAQHNIDEFSRSAVDTADAVRTLVREHRGRYDLPELRVHDKDEMFGWSVLNCPTPALGGFAYYRAGLAIASTLREIVDDHLGGGRGNVLDFACGYGRSLRYSVQDFGADQVWGCEILPDAVQFIAEVLGAHAIQSSTDPMSLHIDERFDVIFVSSLFSHLPERTFGTWLERLHSLLTPTGILVASVHDEILLPEGASLSDHGFWFQPISEVAEIDGADYGATVVTERFMVAAIEAATGSARHVRMPTGLCFDQDIYIIPASAAARLPTRRWSHGAQGAVDVCSVSLDGILRTGGWAAIQDADDYVEHVDLRLDGEFIGRVGPSLERFDVVNAVHQPAQLDCLQSGWNYEVRLDRDARPDSVLTATAVTGRGRRDIVWSTALADLSPGIEKKPAPVVAPVSASHSSTVRVVLARARRAGGKLKRLVLR